MKDASLFQLGIGLETGAQEEDTDFGVQPDTVATWARDTD